MILEFIIVGIIGYGLYIWWEYYDNTDWTSHKLMDPSLVSEIQREINIRANITPQESGLASSEIHNEVRKMLISKYPSLDKDIECIFTYCQFTWVPDSIMHLNGNEMLENVGV